MFDTAVCLLEISNAMASAILGQSGSKIRLKRLRDSGFYL
jgi:hypothetical protein